MSSSCRPSTRVLLTGKKLPIVFGAGEVSTSCSNNSNFANGEIQTPEQSDTMQADSSALQQSHAHGGSYTAGSKEHKLARSTSLPYINRPVHKTQDETNGVFQDCQSSTVALSHLQQKSRSFGADLTNTNNSPASNNSIAVKPAAPQRSTRMPNGHESQECTPPKIESTNKPIQRSEDSSSSSSTALRDFVGYVPRSRALTRAPQSRSSSMPPPASPRAPEGRKAVNGAALNSPEPAKSRSDDADEVVQQKHIGVGATAETATDEKLSTATNVSASSSHRPRKPSAPQQAPPNPVVVSARAEVAAAAAKKEGIGSTFRPRPPPRAGITRGRSCGPQVRLTSLGEATTRPEQRNEDATNHTTNNNENVNGPELNSSKQNGSFASPDQEKQKHQKGDAKTRRRSRSTNSTTNPSAAAFASPQPFARRHNPFAAPSFCAPQDRDGGSARENGSGGGEGLFADGADFSDLLADLDAIEQVTPSTHPPLQHYLHYDFSNSIHDTNTYSFNFSREIIHIPLFLLQLISTHLFLYY